MMGRAEAASGKMEKNDAPWRSVIGSCRKRKKKILCVGSNCSFVIRMILNIAAKAVAFLFSFMQVLVSKLNEFLEKEVLL